jgi:hypothetical protein
LIIYNLIPSIFLKSRNWYNLIILKRNIFNK